MVLKVTVEVNGRTIGVGTAVNRGHPGEPISPHASDRIYELHDGTYHVHDRDADPKPLVKNIIDHMDLEDER